MSGLMIDVIVIDDPEARPIANGLEAFVQVVRGEILPVRFGPHPETHLAVVPIAGQADALPMPRRAALVRLLSSSAATTFPRISQQLLPWRMSLELWERGLFAKAGIPWPALP